MPLEISEDLVSLAYQNLGYFVIEGRQVGHGEVDLLGVKLGRTGEIEDRVHIEVQVGTNPIGVLSSSGARLPDANRDPMGSAKAWMERKYDDRKIKDAVSCAFGGKPYDRVFVHGKMKDEGQLEEFKRAGIKCQRIGDLVRQAEEKDRPRNRLHRAVEIAKLLDT